MHVPQLLLRATRVRREDLAPMLLTFLLLFLTARLGQQIYLTVQISPAVIWPPAGIALALVLLRGYRMWMPIAASMFLAILTSPSQPPFTVVLISAFAQTLQPLIGAYALRQFPYFDYRFERIRCVVTFSVVAMLIACIPASLSSTAAHVSGFHQDALSLAWTRSWAGNVFSMIALTPFLLTWFGRHWNLDGRLLPQKMAAIAFHLVVLYLLFWTPLALSWAFLLLLALFIGFFWVAMRLQFRWMTLCVFLLAALGVAGPVLSGVENPTPLNQRLFSVELFTILFAPIFMLFSALAKEKRHALNESIERQHDLQAALQKLELSDREKDEFISTLAHELRNPLGALSNSLELMEMQGVGSEARESLAIALRQTGQMDKMLRNLLDISRAMQGKTALEVQSARVEDLIDHSVQTVKPMLRSGGQIFKVIRPPKPFSIECDSMRVEQVLVNLLTNAAKYTDRDGRITLSVEREGGEAVFTVTDTGKGIAPHMIDKIFEIFVQDPEALSIQGGLGIGLTLSRRLAELHNGSLKARSEGLGKGSTFIFRLPLKQSHV